MNKEKHKVKIQKIVFETTSSKPITWKDIKHIQFEDDDQFDIGIEYPEDSNGYFYATIIREVEETDEEFNKRMKKLTEEEMWAKERRYELYIRLKKEFENE